MPEIHVYAAEGRTVDQKRQFTKDITDAVVRMESPPGRGESSKSSRHRKRQSPAAECRSTNYSRPNLKRRKSPRLDQVFSKVSGRRRMRLPVAAKIAPQTAGATAGTDASPIPPGALSVGTL